MPPLNEFAIPEHRAKPGTIAVRQRTSAITEHHPMVISMFAQFEKGPALQYNRVAAPVGVGPDTKQQREAWFKQCLDAIGRLEA